VQAMKHTAKVEGLRPFRAYRFTAGDSQRDWWGARGRLEPTDKPVLSFFGQIWQWFMGMLRLPGIMWRNRRFYGVWLFG